MERKDYALLNGKEAEALLPELYAAAQASGKTAVFADGTPCETYAQWEDRMKEALSDPQRYILVSFSGEEIAVYMQYRLCEDTVLLEYTVVAPDWQRTPAFRLCCQYLLHNLPPHIRYLEDWVSTQRPEAIDVNRRIGMEIVGQTESGSHVRMRAQIPDVNDLFR